MTPPTLFLHTIRKGQFWHFLPKRTKAWATGRSSRGQESHQRRHQHTMIPSHLHCSYQHSVLVGRPRGSEHIAVLERIASLVRLVEHSLENSLQIVTVNRLFSVVTRSRGAQPPSPSPPPDAGTFIASAAARAAANACAAGAVTAVAAVGRVSCLNNLPLVSIIWLKKKEVLFFIAVERTGQKKINQKSNKKNTNRSEGFYDEGGHHGTERRGNVLNTRRRK